MNTKKLMLFASVFAIVVLIVGFSACDRVSQIIEPDAPQMAEPSEEISIGVVLPLTGRYADTFGILNSEGFELALSEINAAPPSGMKLKFIIEDDQSTIDGAVAAFNKLIHQEGVSIILGPSTSSQTEMAFPVARENQVVAISPTSAARDLSAISDYVFRVSLTTDKLIPPGIEITQTKLGYQRAATMYDETDLFSTDGDASVQEILAAKGVEVITTETFQGGDTDFSQQLTRIQTLNPDVIFVSCLSPEKPGILMQGHELGISAPFIVRTLTAADVQAAGAAAEGAITIVGWGATLDTPGNQAFVENYSAKFGTEPTNYAARSYATLHILAEAIANAQSTDAAAIRDALASIRDFDTIFGKFSFDANGDAVYDEKVLIVKDGKLVRFE
ncbi:ABC transporter substrate-binding protein [Candidatus Poribacteria bacterium]|nr:ABC transporter substrate-binding protein [Candidatus Poribacteria bacterium]MYH79711.1 ABC transporter substrate-binding protein [Candidatus Poribacteria bacterium]MYK93704.1 ABC transporter substrate-binding protein [Candidatus Poribacteria bacterium]